MGRILALGFVAIAVSACAGQPVRISPVILPDGELRGPVVARRDVPLSTRYEGFCESRPYRWDHGWYRVYGECPPPVIVTRNRALIVRKD